MLTGTEAAATTPVERLRDAAEDALEWLGWLRMADVINDFGRRRGMTEAQLAENDAVLGRAIKALESALKEHSGAGDRGQGSGVREGAAAPQSDRPAGTPSLTPDPRPLTPGGP